MKQFTILRNEEGDLSGDGGGGSALSGASLLSSSQVTSAATASATDSTQPPTQGGGSFDFRSVIGDDGRFAANWVDKLPEELKSHAAHFSKYGTPIQALEHTLSLSQLLGKKSDAVVIPAADASKEDWAPVLKRLGVPDSPDGYGLKVPEKLPEGVRVNEAELKEFATLAHGLGLTPQQVAKLQEYDLGRAGKSLASSAEQAQAYEEQEFAKQKEILTKEWGNGPEAIKKNALAERAAMTFGFTAEEVANDPLFRNARFVMTLARAGAAMSEDTLVKGSDLQSSGGMKARAMDVINNPQNPLYKKYWDGDEDVANQVRSWMTAS